MPSLFDFNRKAQIAGRNIKNIWDAEHERMDIFVDPQASGDAVIGNIGQIYSIGKADINHHFWAIKDEAKPRLSREIGNPALVVGSFGFEPSGIWRTANAPSPHSGIGVRTTQ